MVAIVENVKTRLRTLTMQGMSEILLRMMTMLAIVEIVGNLVDDSGNIFENVSNRGELLENWVRMLVASLTMLQQWRTFESGRECSSNG
jgi:hypothetical protein